MQRRLWVIAGVVVVLVASVTTAVAVTRSDDDGDRFGRHGGMMPGPMHGSQVASEYAYLAEMVAHHEEAVATALELERSERAEMREFGEAVVETQSAQIDQMEKRLVAWYPDRSGEVDYEPVMRDLTGLEGDELDRAFLEDMIGHHMAAVMMSQQLLMRGADVHPEVRDLAASIRDEQHAEIFRMQQWLRDWFDQPWWHGG